MTTIVVADDHHVVREGLCTLLNSEPDFSVIGEAADGVEALNLVEKKQPDILIVDLVMPGMDGLEVTRRVHANSPHVGIIVLSERAGESYVIAALKNGALGYVFKSSSSAVLIRAIREVLQGKHYLSPPLAERALEVYLQKGKQPVFNLLETLTCREHEVMQLALQGLTNAEIAEKLDVSLTTIASHRANLMQKLGLHNQTELVRYALERGILRLDE
ncbi:MAG: hypothetical protein A2Z03_04960 [Chloroflexi bacterium RBG_16_56_8]|nr:MAG: hypothetical protein A2Z03_04960 [Chloroflexi bacterium RBG_16_56_8]